MNDVVSLSGGQLALVKDTIARDCNKEEFDLFMEYARNYGLNPFAKQIIPLVFNKGNQEKRRMSIVVTRDGLRVIASRCRDYRPASEKAEILFDKALVSPTNPKGIVSTTVRLWKQDKAGDWHPVIGEAYWDEFAPVSDEWAYDQEKGRRSPTGKKVLDTSGNWARMPIVMITKCAEAQALRAGWPEEFSGVYLQEEMDRTVAASTASEAVEIAEREKREAALGGADNLMVQWALEGPIVTVSVGEMYDRVIEWTDALDGPETHAWLDRNREALKRFWAISPSDALALKQELEKRVARPASNADSVTEAA